MPQNNPFRVSPIRSLARQWEDEGSALPDLSGASIPSQQFDPDSLTPPTDLVPVFEQSSQRYGVPVNVLMAMGHQESRYRPDAVGVETQYGRAKGLMQYIDDTARGVGIDPFDASQSIDAAARQYADRIAKGYTHEEAIMAHHGGDDRRQWGPKTRAYAQEVMQKAGMIGESMMGQPAQNGSAQGGVQDYDALQAQLDAEEPGRYRVLTPEDVQSLEQRGYTADVSRDLDRIDGPDARVVQSDGDKRLGPWDQMTRDLTDIAVGEQDSRRQGREAEPKQSRWDNLTERITDMVAGGDGEVPYGSDNETTTSDVLLESLKAGTFNVGSALAYAPELVLRSVEGVMSSLDMVGEMLGLPDWILDRKYVGPTDIVEPIIRGKDFGSYRMAGTNDISKWIKKVGEGFENERHQEAVKNVSELADKALEHAIDTGELGQILDILTDPNAWAVGFGQAAPSLAVAMVGGIPAIAALEGGSAVSDVKEFEEKNGKIGDVQAANAVMQTAIVNTLLEKLGLDVMLGKLPKNLRDRLVGATIEGAKGNFVRAGAGGAIGGIAEGATETLQELNENLAQRTWYDEDQSLTEGVLLAAMGGASSGGGIGTISGAASGSRTPSRTIDQPERPEPKGPLGRSVRDAEDRAIQSEPIAEPVVAVEPVVQTEPYTATIRTAEGDINGNIDRIDPDGTIWFTDTEGMTSTFLEGAGAEIIRHDVPVESQPQQTEAVTSTSQQADRGGVIAPVDGYHYRSDGTPFNTEGTAIRAIQNRRLKGYEPVPVDGGWAIAPVSERASSAQDQTVGDDLSQSGSGKTLGSGMAGAISNNFYQGWFDLLSRKQGASTAFRTEHRYPETRRAFDSGQIKTVDDLRRILHQEPGAWEKPKQEQTVAPAPKSIEGRDIDGDWAEFSDDSGSIGVPRSEMPQIKAEHRGAMVNFLDARGIKHKEETVPASQLKPTQSEFSREKVKRAKEFTGGDRSILISSDGHVLDGHHQWLAKRDAGEDVKVIRLDAPIRDLLPVVREFPSATQEDAGQSATVAEQEIDDDSVRMFRSDGTPFRTEAMARQAARNRRLDGYEPVQVEGGWALEPASDKTAVAGETPVDALTREALDNEDAGAFVLTPREAIDNPETVASASPWLMADGTIIGTPNDHIGVFSDADDTYNDYMRRTGAIRTAIFQDAVERRPFVTLHTYPGQKLTEAQKNTLRELRELSGSDLQVMRGETDSDTNPAYRPANVDGEYAQTEAENQTATTENRNEPTQYAMGGLPVVEVPVADLQLSEDVPQFKQGADSRGVVEPLEGEFDRRGLAPLQVWRRLNGDLEVISGRHRLDLAQRTGQETVPVQIHDEADGFTAEQASVLDAELNIRDGQGTVSDYVDFFKSFKYTREEAQEKGLLARVRGKRGYAIAATGSEPLIASLRAGRIADTDAERIALAAPNNERLQSVGLDQIVNQGANVNNAINTMRAVQSMGTATEAETMDMFGFDDSAIREAVDMARVATRKQREIGERLSAISGAARRPEVARREGVDVRDPEAIKQRIEELRAERDSWDRWNTDPEKVAEIREELGLTDRTEPSPVDEALTERHAELDTRIDALSDDQAERAAQHIGINEGEINRLGAHDALKQQHPDDIEDALSLVAPQADTSQDGLFGERPQEEAGDFQLAGQTEQEIIESDQREAQRQRDEVERERQAEMRERADRERDDFVLTGSNLPADELAARGQTDIFQQTDQAEEDGGRFSVAPEIGETITVNGVERPTRNSDGRVIATTEEAIRNFWNWFGDSQVVDDEGRPQVVYHGTSADVQSFESSFGRDGTPSTIDRVGFYFAPDPDLASQYASRSSGAVYPAYVRILNPMPFEVENGGNQRGQGGYNRDAIFPGGFIGTQEDVSKALEHGYDGIIRENEIIAFESTQIKSATGNKGTFDPNDPDIRHSVDATRNLYVAHNLSAENILAANELGGLAAPSLAIARTDRGFDNFGEVTLLADPSMLDDRKIRAFDADVYSPRQPRAYYDTNERKFREFTQGLDPDNLGLIKPDISEVSGQDGARSLLNSDAVRLKFLEEKGRVPRLYNAKVDPAIRRAASLDSAINDSNPELVRIAEQYYRNQARRANESDSARGERYESLFFNEDGTIKDSVLRNFARHVRDYQSTGGKDVSRFSSDLRKRFHNKRLANEYEKWVTDTFNNMVDGRKLFRGFTPSGNRRYVPYTMENVVREMTQKLQAGEGWFYGVGSVRSAYANEMRTLRDIQARRDQIISEADFETIRDESNKVFTDALDKLKPFYKYDADSWNYMEDAGSAIAEGRRGINEAFNVTPEAQKIIDDLVGYLRNLPTTYFEAKAQRAVQFGEFNTAVVPRGMRRDALQVLRDAGLRIKTYNPNVEGDRARVIAEQERLLFSTQDREAQQSSMTVDSLRQVLENSEFGPIIQELINNGSLRLHNKISDVLPSAPAGAQAFAETRTGVIHLGAQGLDANNAVPVFLHEAFHGQVRPFIGTDKWNALQRRLGALYRQAQSSEGRMNEFWREAAARVDNAQRMGDQMTEAVAIEEFGAYAIENYDAAPRTIKKWVDDLIGAVKAWLIERFGIQLGVVTPAQLRALTAAALRSRSNIQTVQGTGREIGGSTVGGSALSLGDTINVNGIHRPTTNSEGRPIAGTEEAVRNFWEWFGDSKVIDEDGAPLVVYHGTGSDFSVFDPSRTNLADGTFATPDAEYASTFAETSRFYDDESTPNVIPLYAKIDNPAYIESDQFNQDSFVSAATRGDIDGIIIRNEEGGIHSIFTIDPEQIKSSTGNQGTFDPTNPDIRYSTRASEHFDDLNKDQKDFLDNIGPERLPQRLGDHWNNLKENLGLRIRQAGVDRYAALLRNDEAIYGEDTLEGSIASSSWVLARMSSAAGGALSAMLDGGRIYLDTKEKVIDVRENTTGLKDVFLQLGSPQEVERFMGWIAANRAKRLMDEGRENLFTNDQIDAGIKLATGQTDDGKSRAAMYRKTWREFQVYRDDVLKIAEQTGIISSEQRQTWREEFYVPFYRVLDDDTIGGPSFSSGLTKQQAYKKLKGGRQKLNDLLENTFMNFHHLLQASLKNQAAQQAIDNAIELDIATPVTESTRDKKSSTWVMRNGEKHWYDVSDALTFKAINALSNTYLNNPIMKAGRAFKRLFTNMITVTPQFIVANTLRDTMQAMATSPTSMIPFQTAAHGIRVYGDSYNRARMLASGGAFSFGHVYGQASEEIKRSLRRTMRRGQVLNDTNIIPSTVMKAWRQYEKVVNASENINRAGIWAHNIESKGKLYAAFEARDLVDFSSHGDNIVVRILIDLVPFLNARAQGLDKLYRSGIKSGARVAAGRGTKADRKAFARFALVTGALAMLSMMLYVRNYDDEEYRKLEDWQRDTYWFMRFGDNAFFIPKPFEVGAIATLTERSLEQFMDPTVGGKKFGERLWAMLTDTFEFDPRPQAIRPIIEVSQDRDSFTGRPIEGPYMDRLSPSLRSRPSTTRLAEAASRGMESALGVFNAEDSALSPLQIDHLIRGYLGQVGTSAVATMDVLWRRAMGEQNPARRWSEYQPIRRFYRDLGAPAPYTRYMTDFYESLKESDRAYADVEQHKKNMEYERAGRVAENKQEELGRRKVLNRTNNQIRKINAQMRQIQIDKTMGSEEKRYRLDRLREIRNMLSEDVVKMMEREKVMSDSRKGNR